MQFQLQNRFSSRQREHTVVFSRMRVNKRNEKNEQFIFVSCCHLFLELPEINRCPYVLQTNETPNSYLGLFMLYRHFSGLYIIKLYINKKKFCTSRKGLGTSSALSALQDTKTAVQFRVSSVRDDNGKQRQKIHSFQCILYLLSSYSTGLRAPCAFTN